MIRKESQAKMIILLSQIPIENRTIKFLCYKIGLSYVSISQELGILEAGGLLNKGQSGRNVYYTATAEAVKEAMDFLDIKREENPEEVLDKELEEVEENNESNNKPNN